GSARNAPRPRQWTAPPSSTFPPASRSPRRAHRAGDSAREEHAGRVRSTARLWVGGSQTACVPLFLRGRLATGCSSISGAPRLFGHHILYAPRAGLVKDPPPASGDGVDGRGNSDTISCVARTVAPAI